MGSNPTSCNKTPFFINNKIEVRNKSINNSIIRVKNKIKELLKCHNLDGEQAAAPDLNG